MEEIKTQRSIPRKFVTHWTSPSTLCPYLKPYTCEVKTQPWECPLPTKRYSDEETIDILSMINFERRQHGYPALSSSKVNDKLLLEYIRYGRIHNL